MLYPGSYFLWIPILVNRVRTQITLALTFTFLFIGIFLPGANLSRTVAAQPLLFIPSDSVMATSVDSLRLGIEELTKEREQLIEELRLLSSQIGTVERSFKRQFSDLQLQHETLNRTLAIQFDTLRAQMPDEEHLRTATFYIRYLNQRQDSLIAYVERLESELDNIPDKHYWGVRNDFKEFDHLLLFTFLGAIMSLGLVLLLRGDNKREQTESADQLTAYLKQEDHVDRLSMSITLLVGSILVLLFIIFIL